MSYSKAVRDLRAELGELLEEQQNTVDLSRFREYDGRPMEFLREVLKFDPWPKQEEVVEALEHHPLVCVVGAAGVGKDALLAAYSLYWTLARGGLVLLMAPTDRQVGEVLFGEIRRTWHRVDGGLPGRLLSRAYEPDGTGESGILGMTSTAVSRLTGHHRGRVLVVLSEAQDLAPFVMEAAFNNANGADDRIVQSGNPLFPHGTFHDAAKGDRWETVTIRAAEHPNVVEGRAVIPGGPSREGIERMRGEWGEESNVYRSRVLSEFPSQDAEGLFDRAWIDAAIDRWERNALKPQGEPMASLDVARYGADGNCLMIRHGPVVVHVEKWGGLSTINTGRRAASIIERFGFRPKSPNPYVTTPWGTILVDSVGMTGAVETLKELGFRTVEFNGGHFGVQQPRFLNRRAEYYFALRDRLHPENGDIAFPRDPELIEELLATRWQEAAGGKARIEEKALIKARIGRSPDSADALSMLFGPEVRRAQTFEWKIT